MYYRITALYVITYVIALPLLCSDLPYSMYFRYDVTPGRRTQLDRAIEENQQRIAVAEDYLRKHGPHHRVFRRLNRMAQKRTQPQLVITVVTVARQPHNGLTEPRYLTQVVTQFVQLLEHEGDNVVFQVCNVHFPPETHHEAVFLSKYVPVVHRESDEEQPNEEDPFEREKLDYTFCLEKSVELNPEYVLMVEDDALPTPDMLHVLRHKLQYRLKLRIRQGELVHSSDDWAFLKLYSIERWQGYGNDIVSFLELTGVGLLGVGRQYFLQFRRLSAQLYTVTTGPFCCTPAVLYPGNMAAEIADFLKSGTCDERYPLDFALSDFAIDKGLTRYKVEPNLVQHVGLVSSIRSDVRDPMEF
ncbi:hypothetical protein Bbelb_343060 [Branchiostoma belcheri]|nr:hypothetical protein Bbelb_343060 [Branchiostoma belcheri]